jgi:hypothetical protein
MDTFDRSGWLIRDRGQVFLATGGGWFTLKSVPPEAGSERPARVIGHHLDPTTVEVVTLRTSGPDRDGGSRPPLVRSSCAGILAASGLRSAARTWMRERGFPYVTLPQVWYRSEEYGEREFEVRHPRQGMDLYLLQSSELPLYLALVAGMGHHYTFGRCFRHEVVHDPDDDGKYLMEFEQLVLGMSMSDLEEGIALGEQLVMYLAERCGVAMAAETFLRNDHLTAAGHGRGSLPSLNDLILFAVPGTWPRQAVVLLVRRLVEVEARLYLWDGEGRPRSCEPDDLESLAGQELRLAIEPAPGRESELARILDVARTMMGADGIGQAVAQQWNPTWEIHPPLEWRPDEQRQSDLRVRSFTSATATAADGSTMVRDAELYVGGIEMIHVREYPDVPSLIDQAAHAGALGTFDYLRDHAGTAPEGMVGLFIGWERLCSVLLGERSAHDILPFPRAGDGSLGGRLWE